MGSSSEKRVGLVLTGNLGVDQNSSIDKRKVVQPPDGLIPMDVDVGVRIESCKNMDPQEDCENKYIDKNAIEDEGDKNAVGDESDEMGEESDEDDNDSKGKINDKYIDQDAPLISRKPTNL